MNINAKEQKRGRGRPRENTPQTSQVNNKIIQTSAKRCEDTQTSHVCNKKVNNAKPLQSIDSNHTPNFYNSNTHDSHNYKLRKRRKFECRICSYRCVECKANVNHSLLPNSPSKNQSLKNSSKLYFNANAIHSNQINSNSLNISKNCTVLISYIPHSQLQSSTLPPVSNPQASLSQSLVNNNMSDNTSEPSYTNEIPIVNNFNLRN